MPPLFFYNLYAHGASRRWLGDKRQNKQNSQSTLAVMATPSEFAFVLSLLRDIAKEEINADLRVTIWESWGAAMKVGVATLVSSVVFGPIGIIVGSFGGGLLAYATSSDFKSLPDFLSDMTYEEKVKLVAVAKRVAFERGIELALANLVTYSPEARDFLLQVMTRYGHIKSVQ